MLFSMYVTVFSSQLQLLVSSVTEQPMPTAYIQLKNHFRLIKGIAKRDHSWQSIILYEQKMIYGINV